MASNTQTYPLQLRGYRSAARLNLQHFLWRQSAGFLLHPRISVPDGARIADIGTGTAIWLLELAAEAGVPTDAQLMGLDVNLAQAPAPEWLPSNVSLVVDDVFAPLPEEWIGTFDIVHVRFFLCVVRDGNPIPVIQRLARMLKPGGWLQWTEMDIQTLHLERASKDASTPANSEHMQKILEIGRAPMPQWPAESQYWVKDLHQTLRQEGFAEVEEKRFERPPWLQAAFQDVTMLAMEEISARHPDGENMRELIGQAGHEMEESRQGLSISATGVTVVAQWPGTSK